MGPTDSCQATSTFRSCVLARAYVPGSLCDDGTRSYQEPPLVQDWDHTAHKDIYSLLRVCTDHA